MRLTFKQKAISLLDSYEVFDDKENTVYTVKGKFAFGKSFEVYDRNGRMVGAIKQKLMVLMPQFDIYQDDICVGSIKRKFAFGRQNFDIEYQDWHVNGDYMGREYSVVDSKAHIVARIAKMRFQWTDTYVLDIPNDADALSILMLVIAIDADKDNRD